MTSAVGGGRGVPKKQTKKQNQLICDRNRGGGIKKSENFADVIYGSPLVKIVIPGIVIFLPVQPEDQ